MNPIERRTLNASNANTAMLALDAQEPGILHHYIDKTRQEVVLDCETQGAWYRGFITASGVIGTTAICLAVAGVAGSTLGALATPLAIVAIAVAAVAIGILIYRHRETLKNGFDPKTGKEALVGLGQAAVGGLVTAVVLGVLALLVAASKDERRNRGADVAGGYGGGWGYMNSFHNFWFGYTLGRMSSDRVIYVYPYYHSYSYPQRFYHVNAMDNKEHSEITERFLHGQENLYRGDRVEIKKTTSPTSQNQPTYSELSSKSAAPAVQRPAANAPAYQPTSSTSAPRPGELDTEVEGEEEPGRPLPPPDDFSIPAYGAPSAYNLRQGL